MLARVFILFEEVAEDFVLLEREKENKTETKFQINSAPVLKKQKHVKQDSFFFVCALKKKNIFTTMESTSR